MGLARMERAKPLFVQTLDVVASFYYGTRTAVPMLTPMPAEDREEISGGPNLLCTRPDVYIESWGYAGPVTGCLCSPLRLYRFLALR